MATRKVYRTTLLTAASNGNSSADIDANINGWFSFWAYGTFNGATAKLQFSPDDGTTWIDIPSASINTSDGVVALQGAYKTVRATISGGGGSESLTVGFDIGASG